MSDWGVCCATSAVQQETIRCSRMFYFALYTDLIEPPTGRASGVLHVNGV